jgi:hypothetical protein
MIRQAGAPVPEGARFQQTHASASQRIEGGAVWTLVDSDGRATSPLVCSQWPRRALLRLGVQAHLERSTGDWIVVPSGLAPRARRVYSMSISKERTRETDMAATINAEAQEVLNGIQVGTVLDMPGKPWIPADTVVEILAKSVRFSDGSTASFRSLHNFRIVSNGK